MNLCKDSIKFHPELSRSSDEVITALRYLHGNLLTSFCLSMPPIVIRSGEDYLLIARHFSFDCLVNHSKLRQIPFIVLEQEKPEHFWALDDIFTRIIIESSKPAVNKDVHSKKLRESAGLLCPLCGKLLRGPRHHKAEKGEKQGYFKITCSGKYDAGVLCVFKAFLNQKEYHLFRLRQYPTQQWLRQTKEKCGKCGGRLYERERFGESRFACEEMFKENGTCSFYEKKGGSHDPNRKY